MLWIESLARDAFGLDIGDVERRPSGHERHEATLYGTVGAWEVGDKSKLPY
jgi:hypothetical protein